MSVIRLWEFSVDKLEGPRFGATRRFMREVGLAKGRGIAVGDYSQAGEVLYPFNVSLTGHAREGGTERQKAHGLLRRLLAARTISYHPDYLACRFVPKHVSDSRLHHCHIRRLCRHSAQLLNKAAIVERAVIRTRAGRTGTFGVGNIDRFFVVRNSIAIAGYRVDIFYAIKMEIASKRAK